MSRQSTNYRLDSPVNPLATNIGVAPMDEPHSSQDGVLKSKFTYRHLNALSSSTPPKDSPLRYEDIGRELGVNSRCVVLIDLDCFYAQVEQVRLGIPKDEPLAVVSPAFR